MFIDSHCHINELDIKKYDDNYQLLLDAANSKGIDELLAVCVDVNDYPKFINIIDNVSYKKINIAIGNHPSKGELTIDDVNLIQKYAEDPRVIAIGETGLDYAKNHDKKVQQITFAKHIDIALELNKPLVVHSRLADYDIIKILREKNADRVGGIMHCFTGDLTFAMEAMALNFYISFSGIITFKNAEQLRYIASQIPIDKILIETDSPYLCPEPYRGKSNEPSFLVYTAEALGKIKNLATHKIGEITSNNFHNLFI